MKTIREYLDKAVLSELESGYVTALKDVVELIECKCRHCQEIIARIEG